MRRRSTAMIRLATAASACSASPATGAVAAISATSTSTLRAPVTSRKPSPSSRIRCTPSG
ncbi:hypothetical protein HU200_046105 [Digitaria exilis]|uniref:Secreted protein n=1 Tax=Digitaria exilis TaxID=1010633 RepID=A0A835EBQ3_9POAL|nr:hypothetical protein HU200_046105 [Digitaria exilis]